MSRANWDAIPESEYWGEFVSALRHSDKRPKLVVDHHLALLWCCDDARRLLADPIPLAIEGGHLVVSDSAQRREFSDFVQTVGADGARILVRGKSRQHWVVVRAWRPSEWDGAVCLMCSPSLPLYGIDESGLARALNLTSAEVRVLNGFAELNTPSEIASDLGVSLSTVRSHFKTIYAKASVSTSAQLLRLAHSFCFL